MLRRALKVYRIGLQTHNWVYYDGHLKKGKQDVVAYAWFVIDGNLQGNLLTN